MITTVVGIILVLLLILAFLPDLLDAGSSMLDAIFDSDPEEN